MTVNVSHSNHSVSVVGIMISIIHYDYKDDHGNDDHDNYHH